MGDENQYHSERPGWYRDSNGIARIGEKPRSFKGQTPWKRRTDRARQEDVEFIKTIEDATLAYVNAKKNIHTFQPTPRGYYDVD